ncbi:holo-ACP synthase [Ectothiorhodospiraceae bacterium 2226]|nr:holo-ACP synthase [Ectothiorhodospiraceae bacterium 2226]
MIYGIGTDIVRIARVEAGLARFGDAYARRILSAPEWRDYTQSSRPAALLAKRFAAKEAAAKALGTGMRAPVTLRAMGVEHAPSGAPRLVFHGALHEWVRGQGVGEWHLSLADERDHAVAFVVMTRK